MVDVPRRYRLYLLDTKMAADVLVSVMAGVKDACKSERAHRKAENSAPSHPRLTSLQAVCSVSLVSPFEYGSLSRVFSSNQICSSRGRLLSVSFRRTRKIDLISDIYGTASLSSSDDSLVLQINQYRSLRCSSLNLFFAIVHSP